MISRINLYFLILLATPLHAVYNRTDLLDEARQGNANQVTEILNASTSADVNSVIDGDTSLILAARNGHDLVIRALVDYDRQGVDFEFRDKNGDTALMNAIKHGHLDCVKILLKEKADANSRDALGKSALQVAMDNHNQPMIKLLKRYGAQL